MRRNEDEILEESNVNFTERRKNDRKKLIVDVQFEGGDATGIANSTDISLGGLFLKTNAELTVGRPLRLRLTLGGRDISLEGTVAFHDTGNGYGVSFINLSPEKEFALRTEME